MRNFKDLSRALASIAGGLKSIKDIIDTIEPGGGGSSTITYKINEEREIGVWTDGTTPLYEYVVEISGTGSNNWNELSMADTPVADADAIIVDYFYIDNSTVSVPIQWYNSTTYSGLVEYNKSTQKLRYEIGTGYGSYTGIAVLRYTKTSE